MSVKDKRYFRICPICNDLLIGTDDGLEVFESLKDQLEGLPSDVIPNCTLCGEECKSRKHAEEIVNKGVPALYGRGKRIR